MVDVNDAMDRLHWHAAAIDRVVDGDTVDARVDEDFHHYALLRFRLMGYNAPELHGFEKPLGEKARDRLIDLVMFRTVCLRTYKGDSFGRWLCDMFLEDGTNVVDQLIREGYGVPWDGRGQRPSFDPLRPFPAPNPGWST